MSSRIPRSVLAYGLLGLIPFLAPPVVALARPDLAGAAIRAQIAYGALILSFLGGVRWGLAVMEGAAPRAETITLSMLPSVGAFGIVTLMSRGPRLELLALTVALIAQWLWDQRASEAPPWFARLRTILTVGAVAGLLAGAWVAG